MIPILYGISETTFTSQGKGRLFDAATCVVTEELNGIYELEFTYPITGYLYNEMITNGGIVYCTHDASGDLQAFEIYKFSAPINGIVTFNAHHVSYRLSKIVVGPFSGTSCADAVSKIAASSMQTNPFTFTTDKTVATAFELKEPMSARALLGGVEGSLLDAYGGEYKFDNFTVSLLVKRGTVKDVTIKYGKNLTDLTKEHDETSIYNAVVPFWKGDGDQVVWLNDTVVASGQTLKWAVPLDCSSYFSEKPTTAQLRSKAEAYLESNEPWIPDENVTFSFVPLWQTTEYKQFKAFELVGLGDIIKVEYEALRVTGSARIVKTVYNVLADRYDSIEAGKLKSSLSEAILSPVVGQIATNQEKLKEYVPSSGGTFTGDVNFSGTINGVKLSVTDIPGGSSATFDMPNADKSLFIVIGASVNNKCLLITNTSTAGSVSVTQTPSASNITYTTATRQLTITSASVASRILRIQF